MSHQLLLTAFGVAFSLEFVAFGMQRAVLLISRETYMPYQVAEALLPTWFPAIWILRVAKWGCLLTIAFTWGWSIAGGLLAAEVVLTAILPIPYGLYTTTFWKRATQIREEDPQAGELLQQILLASKRHGA